jgi:hypothetical protein
MTLGDNLWLLFGSMIGIFGAGAVAYGVSLIERLVRSRANTSIAPTSSAVDPGAEAMAKRRLR